jgi:DNA-binding response OmpR family regulator
MEPAEARPTLLVVDDTEDIRALLQAGLTRHGFRVLQADGGRTMDSVLDTTPVDLIVLDSMMPGEDGLSICQRLSKAGGPPIIMLSAAGDDVNRIKGLNLGAEDYMAKPFNMDELAVRIRIVLRRQAPAAPREAADTVHFAGWSLDNTTRRLTSPAGRVLELSPAEFAVLHVFLGERDRPLKREDLLKGMRQLHGDSTDRSLDALMSRLRRKLKYADPDSPDLIETVYGVGYIFRAK